MDEELRPCKVCLRRIPTAFVSFTEITGMLVVRQERRFFGLLCRACLGPLYRRYLTHTLLLGWFGVFSFFLTPFYALENTFEYLKARRTLAAANVNFLGGQIRPS
jgi:hypothetical protein